MLRVLITGAAGNLGSLLSHSLVGRGGMQLHLLIHKTEVADSLKSRSNVTLFRGDLAKPDSLFDAMQGVDVVVHFAGVLFKANPEKFLPTTNTLYFDNLLQVAVACGVKRIILISFPHVEGESTPQHPAQGRLDARPDSAHAATRLQEEQALFRAAAEKGIEAVSLRVGMVYGEGILMIDAAQWFAKHYLLGVWKRPTYIHLISKVDFVQAVTAAIEKEGISGIYHIGDEGVQTLQEFLDTMTVYKGNHKPWRMPLWMIMSAARGFECFSRLFGTKSPLTRDFITIGMQSYYGDTERMRVELVETLKYKTYQEGLETF